MIRLASTSAASPVDCLRPPSPLDLLAHAYKDWLHLNVFVPDERIVALVNVSLHGDPLAPGSLAVGSVVVHDAASGRVYGTVDVRNQADARVSGASIAVDGTARVGLGEHGRFLTASGRARSLDGGGGWAEIDVFAEEDADPLDVEGPIPFGSGWIGWRATPRLRVAGSLDLEGRVIDLGDAIGYHDHNWGRWFWGDDIGWRWGTFPAADALHVPTPAADISRPASITVAHRTNRSHRSGEPVARAQAGALAHDYDGRTVSIAYEGLLDVEPVRLPGSMAAQRSDRRRPDLPERVLVSIDDGFDRLRVEFAVSGAVQLITSEPTRPGHTFIHELFGRFELSGHMAGSTLTGTGVGVFEHVD